MSKSLPSKKICVVNAPEISGFSAKFDYNFFMADERVNDTGQIAPKFITKRPSETLDSSFIDSKNFQSKVPRLVKLEWRPVIGPKEYLAQNVSIARNFNKIHNEQDFTLGDYSNIDLQDTGADQRLNFFLRRALEEVQKGFAPPNNKESPLDVSKTLNALTSRKVKGSFLSSVLVNLKELGVTFVNKRNREQIATSLAAQIQKTKVRFQLNNRVLTKILSSMTENPIGLFEDEAEDILSAASEIESEAISQGSAGLIAENEYDLEVIEYIGVRKIDAPASFDSTVQPVGYIIDKEEITENGAVLNRSPIIVENPLSSTTADFKIKYGGKYVYRIKSVIFVEVQAQDLETNDVIAISFLVCSQDSSRRMVECVESVPPPPPADFTIAWDYKNTAARITWNFPTNPQRDIKYFQLFRRANIDVPFELIKEFDFDDSVIKTPRNESPDFALVDKLTNPRNFYLDNEFGRDSKFIYAMCSVDAHGMSSNYGIQFEVGFDRFKNKIIKRLISVSGAPKAYPNMYLNQDTFVDTIKDSGHKKLKIVFNPEFLNVLDSNGNDLNLLRADSNSSYKLTMLNVDLQSQQNITISLDDRRPSTEIEEFEE